ncbi:MAG TPA: hypothetical protein VG497_26260 [Kribbella sp.]|nr:hypothetical protein [Kribbella sp.]
MRRKQDRDQRRAEQEREARERLLDAGAKDVAARPWRPKPIPLSAVDFTQFAAWRAAELSEEDLLAALTLLPAARAEVDEVEAGLLFMARSSGLTWAEIADAMGFSSPQACQQRFNRLAARQDGVS